MPLLGVELGRSERNPLLGRGAGEIVLRQIGPIVGRRVVGAQHREAAGVAFPPQHLGGSVARGAAADDDDRRRQPGAWRPRRRRRACSSFSRTKALPSRCSTRQHGDRVQRRRAQRLAGAQAETGMVPRTADGIVDEKPLGKRAAVVRARRRRSRTARRRGARATPVRWRLAPRSCHPRRDPRWGRPRRSRVQRVL